jgi:hypothetical protein
VYADLFDFLNLSELAEGFATRGFGSHSGSGEVGDFGLDVEVELVADICCRVMAEEAVVSPPNGLFGYG